jgi:hypothetical protein
MFCTVLLQVKDIIFLKDTSSTKFGFSQNYGNVKGPSFGAIMSS